MRTENTVKLTPHGEMVADNLRLEREARERLGVPEPVWYDPYLSSEFKDGTKPRKEEEPKVKAKPASRKKKNKKTNLVDIANDMELTDEDFLEDENQEDETDNEEYDEEGYEEEGYEEEY